MRHFLLICVSVILFPISLSAQETDSLSGQWKPNSIYGSVGIGGVYLTTTAFYERLVVTPFKNSSISPFAKIGVGYYGDWNGEGPYYLAQLGIITGRQKHHFESSAGVVYYQKDGQPFASILIGYRKQAYNKPFMFRTGIAYPEALYIGIGWSFQ